MLTPGEANLIVREVGNAFLFKWEKEQVEAKLFRLHEHGERTTGELIVRSLAPGITGHLHQATLNLLSTRSRKTFADQLSSRRNNLDWPAMIEQVCLHALVVLRQGEPVKLVTATQPVEEEQYLLDPLVPLGNPTILFGEGGTAKSHIALLCGLILEIPWQDNPALFFPPPHPTPGLYLDWEMTERDFRRRLHNLAAGCNLPQATMNYRECRMPLADDLDRVQECMDDLAAQYVIIDSAAGAAGGDINTAETTLRLFGAIRQLRTTTFLIAHTSKNPETKKRTPFGSVFFWNYARQIWEVIANQEEGGTTINVGLFHRKSNVSGLHKPLGLRFTFDSDSTSVEEFSPKSIPALLERMGLKSRILDYLKDKQVLKADIASALDAKETTVQSRLTELKTEGKVVLLSGNLWALAYNEEG